MDRGDGFDARVAGTDPHLFAGPGIGRYDPMPEEIDQLRVRLDRLERTVRSLAERVESLERRLGPPADTVDNREAVRGKVTYDWQS